MASGAETPLSKRLKKANFRYTRAFFAIWSFDYSELSAGVAKDGVGCCFLCNWGVYSTLDKNTQAAKTPRARHVDQLRVSATDVDEVIELRHGYARSRSPFLFLAQLPVVYFILLHKILCLGKANESLSGWQKTRRGLLIALSPLHGLVSLVSFNLLLLHFCSLDLWMVLTCGWRVHRFEGSAAMAWIGLVVNLIVAPLPEVLGWVLRSEVMALVHWTDHVASLLVEPLAGRLVLSSYMLHLGVTVVGFVYAGLANLFYLAGLSIFGRNALANLSSFVREPNSEQTVSLMQAEREDETGGHVGDDQRGGVAFVVDTTDPNQPAAGVDGRRRQVSWVDDTVFPQESMLESEEDEQVRPATSLGGGTVAASQSGPGIFRGEDGSRLTVRTELSPCSSGGHF